MANGSDQHVWVSAHTGRTYIGTRPPKTEFNPGDPAGNLQAWQREWDKIHPAVKGMIWYGVGMAALVAMTIGIIIGLVL